MSAAEAAGTKFKTLGSVTGGYSLYCLSRSGEPKVHFYFDTSHPHGGMGGSMAIIKTGEGLYARDWPPALAMTVPWYLFPSWDSATGERFLFLTGSFGSIISESIELKIFDSTSGRFDGTLKYFSSTGIRVDRAVRCSAWSEGWVP